MTERLCIRTTAGCGDLCSTIYRWRDGIYLDAAEDGRLTGMDDIPETGMEVC